MKDFRFKLFFVFFLFSSLRKAAHTDEHLTVISSLSLNSDEQEVQTLFSQLHSQQITINKMHSSRDYLQLQGASGGCRRGRFPPLVLVANISV